MSVLESHVSDYLKNLHNEYINAKETRASTPELSYRTHLHNFYLQVSKDINDGKIGIIHEPSSTKSGRPDFRFHNKENFGIYGYIEVKALSEASLTWIDFEKQINKYVLLGSNVILTDGLEYMLFEGNTDENADLSPSISVNLVRSKKEFFEGTSIENNFGDLDGFDRLIASFLDHSQPRDISRDSLIDLLARRAHLIANDVETLLTQSQKGTVNEGLENEVAEIFNMYKLQLDETLDERTFSNLVGQLLIFSLLVSYKELINNKEKIEETLLINYFSESGEENYRPIKALINLINEVESELDIIKVGWIDAAYLLSYVIIDKEDLEDYHLLYEKFHESYDSGEKIDFGAYATPKELSDYLIKFSRFLAVKDLDTDLFNEEVKVIDPSCGTGTLLESLVQHSKDLNIPIKSDISGVEVLPVPYTLAHMRMNQILNDTSQSIENPKVFLGNSLSNLIVSNDDHSKIYTEANKSIKLLNAEYNGLQQVTLPPLLAILGNPPSSDGGLNTGENFTEIEEAIEEFRPPKEERKARQNIQKQLTNDFVKFIMWACLKIDDARGGLISFIIPNSALINKTYTYMRRYLLENFQEIYILEIDSDMRKRDSNPQNLFNTQQGRALMTLVKKPNNLFDQKKPSANVYYYSLKNLSIEEKIAWLEKDQEVITQDYKEINPYGWLKSFIPIDVERTTKQAEIYQTYTPIDKIFNQWVSGVKTGCTALVTHPEKEGLERKLEAFMDEKIDDDRLFEEYFKGQARVGNYRKGWKRAYVAREIKSEYSKGLIVPYDFRPFIKSNLFYSKRVMKEASSDGGRARPELEHIFLNNDYQGNLALAVAKEPSLIGKNLDQFISVIEDLPDNDLASRNNSYIFPLVFPNKESKKLINNINQEIIEKFQHFYKNEESSSEEIGNDIILYIYAVLSSKTYRIKFEDIIYHGLIKGLVRIPLTKEKDIYKKLVEKGRELVEYQLQKNDMDDLIGLEHNFENNINLSKIQIKSDEKQILFIGESKEKFVLKNVPNNVLDFRMKGYDILKTFLKYKLYAYVNRSFNEEDLSELVILINRIAKYLECIDEIDEDVEELISNKLFTL